VPSGKIALLTLRASLLLCLATWAGPATGAGDEDDPKNAPFAKGIGERTRGRPSVRLDRLEFAAQVPATRTVERHLRFALRKAARRADWGAGRHAKIEFRVLVEELTVVEADGVVSVRCTALGRLPKGKSARSRIEFSGKPAQKKKIVGQVLEIVARGVVTRLAALERERRAAARRG
jgi:hypothetical protein